ncbi:MAG: YidC/Oxa1 family membrane protein insertase [Candidatus Paceibacterota bacterium]
MSFLYNEFLYRPLLNALVFIYDFISFEDLGLAVILLTVFIRLILFPLFHKGSKNQAIIQKIQPKIKEISDNFKDNKEEQVKRIMEIYKENKINPFSGILLLLIQLPILLALFHVFYYGLSSTDSFSLLYSFVPKPESFNFSFLGLINLKEPSIIVVVLAAAFQYFQGWLSLPASRGKSQNPAEDLGKKMVLIGPFLTFFILYSLPSVVGLYWITTSIFSSLQQIIINNSLKKNDRDKENLRGTLKTDEHR